MGSKASTAFHTNCTNIHHIHSMKLFKFTQFFYLSDEAWIQGKFYKSLPFININPYLRAFSPVQFTAQLVCEMTMIFTVSIDAGLSQCLTLHGCPHNRRYFCPTGFLFHSHNPSHNILSCAMASQKCWFRKYTQRCANDSFFNAF